MLSFYKLALGISEAGHTYSFLCLKAEDTGSSGFPPSCFPFSEIIPILLKGPACSYIEIPECLSLLSAFRTPVALFQLFLSLIWIWFWYTGTSQKCVEHTLSAHLRRELLHATENYLFYWGKLLFVPEGLLLHGRVWIKQHIWILQESIKNSTEITQVSIYKAPASWQWGGEVACSP